MNAEPFAHLGRPLLYEETTYQAPVNFPRKHLPVPLLSRSRISRGTLLSAFPRALLPRQAPNPDSAHLDRVQGVPYKHQAHAAKAAGQEVLNRTDGFRLVGHGQSPVSALGSSRRSRSGRAARQLHSPFAYIRVGGALGGSEGGSRGPRLASARSLLPAAAPPSWAGLSLMLFGRGFGVSVMVLLLREVFLDLTFSFSGPLWSYVSVHSTEAAYTLLRASHSFLGAEQQQNHTQVPVFNSLINPDKVKLHSMSYGKNCSV